MKREHPRSHPRPARPGLRLRLVNESAWSRLPRKMLGDCLAAAYAGRCGEPAALNLLVVDDEGIAGFNRRFKGRDGPTDVLAFPDGDPDPRDGTTQLGDIVINATTAAREAEGRRGERPDWSARHELALYALHGLLHLLGMDDDDDEGRAAMRAAQIAEFSRLGLPLPPD